MDKVVDLPWEIVLRCLAFAAAGPRPQLNLLSLSSSIYIAAIQLLYHSPRVSVPIASFFFASDADLPLNWKTLPVAELVRLGHTKLAALRHVRYLHITLPALPRRTQRLPIRPPRAKLEGIDRATLDAAACQVRRADEWLRWLGKGITPSIKSVQIDGVSLDIHPSLPLLQQDGRHPVIRDFLSSLAEHFAPESWCEDPATIVTSVFARHPGLRATLHYTGTGSTTGPPPDRHLHVRTEQPFSVTIGGTTHLYLHKLADAQANGTAAGASARGGSYRAPSWIGFSIQMSYKVALGRLTKAERETLLKSPTRVIMYGLGGPLSLSSEFSVLGIEDGDGVYDRSEEAQKAVHAIRIQAGEYGCQEQLTIEIGKRGVGSRCPVCRDGC